MPTADENLPPCSKVRWLLWKHASAFVRFIFSPEKQNPLKCASLSQTTCGPPSAFQSLAYRRHRKRPLTVKFNSAENQTEKWKQNMDLGFISCARLTCLSAVPFRSSRPAFFPFWSPQTPLKTTTLLRPLSGGDLKSQQACRELKMSCCLHL